MRERVPGLSEQLVHHGPVGIRQVVFSELSRIHPEHLHVLPQFRYSLEPVHPVDKELQAHAVVLESRAAEILPDVSAHAQLLQELPGQ
jgi:hypothetical protein